MDDFFEFVNRIQLCLGLTISVIADVTFVGDKSIGEIGRCGIGIVALNSFAHISDFQHLSSPRINNRLSCVYKFFGNSISEYYQTLLQSNYVFVMQSLSAL